jgi:hypothetical protein
MPPWQTKTPPERGFCLAPGWSRTNDLSLRRRTLYPLSYGRPGSNLSRRRRFFPAERLLSPLVRLLRHLAAASILALAATNAGASAGGTQPLTAKDVRYWTAVAACETGGGGPPKWDWGSKHRPGEGTLFQGGLGISALMWKTWGGELGLLAQYPHAYEAPPLVQMQVADYGVRVHHATWGCKG